MGNTEKTAGKTHKTCTQAQYSTWQKMPKPTTTWHGEHSGSGMAMDAHGGHLWVWVCVVGPNSRLGHGKEASQSINGRYRVVRCTATSGKQQKTMLGGQGQGWTQFWARCTVGGFWGIQAPSKNNKTRQQQKNKQNGNASTSKRHRHTCKYVCMSRLIFTQKNQTTAKNPAAKAQNTKLALVPKHWRQRAKKLRPKTRKIHERAPETRQQPKKQRKQQNNFCSKKSNKRKKNTDATANIRAIWPQTETTRIVRDKRPKWR